mmetsp:Transcript_28098/g.71855  ORF Transcript_28098/g.71855 Transcript_28098/m.71855 type:complete len:184 (+) Transcript_28098:280-831(+)
MPPKKNGRKAKWTEERHQLAADARARREILENDATHGPSWEPLATDEHERAAADAELDMEMAEAVVSDDDQPMALATGVDFDPGATRRRLRNSELHRRGDPELPVSPLLKQRRHSRISEQYAIEYRKGAGCCEAVAAVAQYRSPRHRDMNDRRSRQAEAAMEAMVMGMQSVSAPAPVLRLPAL